MIRDARVDDVSAIRAIWNDVIATSTITFTTVEKTDADIEGLLALRPVFVAEDAGQVIGFASFGAFRGGPGYRFVAEYTIYLNESHHGRGFAEALLESVEKRASLDGIDTLIAGIDGGNGRAQQFHKKNGFSHVGLLPGVGEKFGARHDLVLMQKKLNVSR